MTDRQAGTGEMEILETMTKKEQRIVSCTGELGKRQCWERE